MRGFDYTALPKEVLNNEIMNMVSAIHEFRGKQDLYIQTQPMVLTHLLEIAKIQSTGASNRIEGIYTSDERLTALVNMRTEPRNRSEAEIAGYREVLSLIHENYDHIPLRSNIILQLHRDLYQFNPGGGGKYKVADNIIAETDVSGVEKVRFVPASAFETPEAMDRLTQAFREGARTGDVDPLILIPMFVLDFLCIHPFTDGNGRMSRLLTLLLLYNSGYIVGKYISIEKVIEETKERYYEALEESSVRWHEGANDYTPFVGYYLSVLLRVYRDFSSRVSYVFNRTISKPHRVRDLFADTLGRLSKSDILNKFPDISVSTVEAALAVFVREGYILKIGAGKKTAYIRNMEATP
jgi:Fic family protein